MESILRSCGIVRPVSAGDIASVCSIYNHHVATTHVTFEEEPVHADVMSERVAAITSALPYLVCEVSGAVVGRWVDVAYWGPTTPSVDRAATS